MGKSKKLLSQTTGKTSKIDFTPTSLIKRCPDSFSVIISRLVDLSFSEGTFPLSKVLKNLHIKKTESR